jgi:hypothetical protein
MREAPEPDDDLQMASGILDGTVVGRSFAQELDGDPLVFDVLGCSNDRQQSTRWSAVGQARRQKKGAGAWTGSPPSRSF